MNSKTYSVSIKITNILGKGVCPNHHKVGDVFKVIGAETVNGLCGWAYHAIMPFMTVLRFGGEFPWEEDNDTAIVCCPDPHNPVIFELRREDRKLGSLEDGKLRR